MKISLLKQLLSINRDVQFPIAYNGQTMRVTLGQIMDVLSAAVVPFHAVYSYADANYATGSTNLRTNTIFDTISKKFYACLQLQIADGGGSRLTRTYYSEWDNRALFYDENDEVRKDCLFLAADGSLYKFNGDTLILAGLTNTQADQLKKNTPIRVESEEEMERMIADGEVEDGQLYYIPEE